MIVDGRLTGRVMTSSTVWMVNNSGAVNVYNVRDKELSELDCNGTDFKRICSTIRSTWSVGGDHQIYVYVPATDVPIRVTVSTYENQRWNPVSGFTDILLPTDRPNFSDEHGLESLPKESFHMPSKHWVWESDWYCDDTIDGEPLGPEGWMYAIDFPMQYSNEHRWNSLARRRKWLRTRRYTHFDEWALIESIHGDHVAEPFIDVAAGGYDVPGGSQDDLSVWAITVLGRVMFREQVATDCPEGRFWCHISTPSKNEINQISVGPTGLVWTVSWDGSAWVRLGVTRENLKGTGWYQVPPPTNDGEPKPLMQVSVGVDAVWAITRDHKVWFRKGVRGLNAGTNEASATGSGWVEMVNQMGLLSVSANDQVWALSTDFKVLYFRTGISYGELTGKTWKPVSSPTMCGEFKRRSLVKACDSLSIDSGNSLDASSDTSENTAWIWLTASGCNVNGDLDYSTANNVGQAYSSSATGSQLSLSADSQQSFSIQGDRMDTWKRNIRQQINGRFNKEMKDFVSAYPTAIEKGTWIKTCKCYVLTKDNPVTWTACQLELERQGTLGSTESGTLTCTYSARKLTKDVLNLSEIMCVTTEYSDRSKSGNSTILVICKGDLSTWRLSFRSDSEYDDWFTSLNMSCCDVAEIRGHIDTKYVKYWCLSAVGEVYVCYGKDETDEKFYRHLGGGHFRRVETCSAGVTWAITNDHHVYVYTGGYGGGAYRGISGANASVNIITDTMSLYVYENQRWNPMSGFAPKGLPTDRFMWSDKTGRIECTKERTKPPSIHWQWTGDWCIDYKTADGVDANGWQYAPDFPFEYHGEKKFTDYVRRRRWVRKCKLTTNGPWMDLATTNLISVSLHSPAAVDGETEVHVWGVSSSGEALCRLGVTANNGHGTSWLHVQCECPLVSISVGGKPDMIQVWAIARDGSAFLRHGIWSECRTGTQWLHVEPPKSKAVLRKIAVGASYVYAVDTRDRAWLRAEIVPTFPEGTHWIKVSDNVLHVDVSDTDEIWAIVRKKEKKDAEEKLVIAKRSAVTDKDDVGTGWQMEMEGIVTYVSTL